MYSKCFKNKCLVFLPPDSVKSSQNKFYSVQKTKTVCYLFGRHTVARNNILKHNMFDGHY